MNNSDPNQNKYFPKLLEINGVTDHLLATYMAKKSDVKKSSNEMSVSRGNWWEITYQKTKGNETFVNKGANWEIAGIPIFSNDINSLISKVQIIKELLNNEKGLKESSLNTINHHLDKICAL